MRPSYSHSLSFAYSRAASSDRIDKTLRAAHEASAEAGPVAFAVAAMGRLQALSGKTRSRARPGRSAQPPRRADFQTPRAPDQMLEGYLAARGRGRQARLLLDQSAPSLISKDVLFMSFLNRTPAEMVPALLDWALASMAQSGEAECCKSLLFLGADPNRPAPSEGSVAGSGARVPAYPLELVHPLADISQRAGEGYSEPSCLQEALLYLAMGAHPDGALSELPAGARKGQSLRVRKGKRLSPMAQCFSTGGASIAKALFEAGARSPHEPDLGGDIPALIAPQTRYPGAREALHAFAAQVERDSLLAQTSPAKPSASSPRL